jgi:hypothetical protein
MRPSGLRPDVQVFGRPTAARHGHGCAAGRRFCCRLSNGAAAPSVRITHAAVAGAHIAGWSRAIGVRRPRPAVRLSGPSVSAGRTGPSWVTSADEQVRSARALTPCWDDGWRPPSYGGRPQSTVDTAARGGVRAAADRTPRQRPLSGASGRGRVSGRLLRTPDPAARVTGSRRPAGVRWWGAAAAGTPGGAGGRAGPGARRGPRSSPAAPVPGRPRRSAPIPQAVAVAVPAADDRAGGRLRVDAEPGPGAIGPGAQLHGEVGQEDQLLGLAVGWPVTSSCTSVPSGWGRRGAATPPG